MSRNPAAFPAEKLRLAKSRNGSIGCAALASQLMKATSSSPPPERVAMTSVLLHPTVPPRTTPQTIPTTAKVISTVPGTSSGRRVPRLSATFSAVSAITTSPMGTLIQKIPRQATPWVTAPPTIGPASTPKPVIPAKIPVAQPRRSGGKPATSSPIAIGMMNAAPAPCTVRAAIKGAYRGGDCAHR